MNGEGSRSSHTRGRNVRRAARGERRLERTQKRIDGMNLFRKTRYLSNGGEECQAIDNRYSVLPRTNAATQRISSVERFTIYNLQFLQHTRAHMQHV